MKLTSLLLLVGFVAAYAHGYSQVTLSENNVPLQQIFKKIRQQTGYDFLYSDELIQQAGKTSVHVQNAPLDLALQTCLRDKPLLYRIIDRTIFVSAKYAGTVTPQPEIENPFFEEVTGVVLDEKSVPIAGVTVYSRMTHEITVTNEKGSFRFGNVSKGDTLVFTSVNYEPVSLPVKAGEPMRVVMKLKITSIENLTIFSTGYQKIDKERATS